MVPSQSRVKWYKMKRLFETTLLLDLGKGYISGLYCTNWDLAAQQILVAVVLVRLQIHIV